MEKLLAIIKALAVDDALQYVANEEMALLPGYFKALDSTKHKRINAAALSDLFWIAQTLLPAKGWIEAMAEMLTANLQRQYVHNMLAPQLLAVKKQSELTDKLLQCCREYLQQRADNQPQPPANWSRSLPDMTDNKKQWQLLKAFLESPDEKVFDYRKNQSERNELEGAIKKVVIDLKTETIKKGSPHTLRITKTQAAYQRLMKEWDEDVVLLDKVMAKGG